MCWWLTPAGTLISARQDSGCIQGLALAIKQRQFDLSDLVPDRQPLTKLDPHYEVHLVQLSGGGISAARYFWMTLSTHDAKYTTGCQNHDIPFGPFTGHSRRDSRLVSPPHQEPCQQQEPLVPWRPL